MNVFYRLRGSHEEQEINSKKEKEKEKPVRE